MASPFQESTDLVRVHAAGPVEAKATVPGSKSLTNRFLLLAAMAEGSSLLSNPLSSDDTRYMREALAQLGVAVQEETQGWRVTGRGRWQSPSETLFIGNAGTAMRFLTPALAACSEQAAITGNERMLVRPIGDLVDGLRQLGVTVTYTGQAGYPPLRVRGPLTSGRAAIRGDASSQYLSGLLMALPLAQGHSDIHIEGSLVSRTYVDMTLDCMAALGVKVDPTADYTHFSIPGNQRYQARAIAIEPDASTASYWLALPLMVGGGVTIPEIPEKSHQGDFGLIEILEKMGARVERNEGAIRIEAAELRGVDVDMNTQSDVAPTLAVVATRAKSPTTIRNIYNMRIKECDRIDTLQRAFDSLGLTMESGRDWIKVYPGRVSRPGTVDPEDDHRMAMVFALLGLADGGVSITTPECVAKTYPNFYRDFGRVLARRD
ncbi:3-phosphoshikimate 1-carboxyvinyltransferase [Sulfidibacter corallicola]|uniref:3-phosphoshikimate 1-carboxyvinyltransferase n=1 Tax=Sulfidibacter corallicola TaxID=2818388 RepID=A0A8A4TVE1_SULCO|nr:3-phosphoshikimate 1-carboxyvinyltransferase [Sulfidibacter corallicola]QTD53926.1 3-phosphoshikimate 1-carboxyvinyltransferase [Sulfidibacter corallicola]